MNIALKTLSLLFDARQRYFAVLAIVSFGTLASVHARTLIRTQSCEDGVGGTARRSGRAAGRQKQKAKVAHDHGRRCRTTLAENGDAKQSFAFVKLSYEAPGQTPCSQPLDAPHSRAPKAAVGRWCATTPSYGGSVRGWPSEKAAAGEVSRLNQRLIG